jgi:magnesium chelatase family protein
MPSILPPMSLDEALETTKIHSVAGKLGTAVGLMSQRPFRAPHHMASPMALIGGGNSPQPGEVSLAHNGVLFLDEMPEFGHSVLEVLRQPLEDKHITISRVRYTVDYPSNFTLVASMNPCPCGYYNHPTKECSCSAAAVHRYVGRISGPLMDRIDLHVEIVPVSREELSSKEEGERSAVVRERVMRARAIQAERFRGTGIYTNTMMSSSMLRRFCPLSEPVRRLLDAAMERLQLSARAYDRIIKVARTIADLAGAADIEPSHISEAITYRSLDRESWGRERCRIQNSKFKIGGCGVGCDPQFILAYGTYRSYRSYRSFNSPPTKKKGSWRTTTPNF